MSTRVGSSSALGTRRAGLDGMRGLGILVMLGFHGEIRGTQGAFLALSQFFTLSGFLITGVLLRNHVGPGKSLRSFWIRRARRLMPAAYVALAGIVLFGATVATQQQADALPGDVLAAATWTANWRFVFNNQSYVDLFAAPSPVQHFWSLAIEEQFYVVLPIALFFLLRRTRSRRVLAYTLGTAALASTAWMAFLHERGASLDRLYYGTDTRVAEFLTGCVFAVVLTRVGTDFSARTRRAIAIVSVVALALTVWGWVDLPLRDGFMWRGGFFVFSLLTCALILAVLADAGPVARLYSWKGLAAIGLISYGLYLYHWPIFLWLDGDRTGLSLYPLFALRVAVTFALAILSYRLIERPVLEGASFGVPRHARFVLAPLAAIVLVAAAPLTVTSGGTDPLATLNASTAMPRVASDGVLDVLLIPDDANGAVMRGLQAAAAANSSVRLTVAPRFECTGGLTATKAGRTCANWARTWPALVKEHNPDVVLLYADSWGGEPLADVFGADPQAQTAGAQEAMGAGVGLLTTRGAPVVWATSGKSFVEALRLSVHPFNRAMTRLIAERTDMHEVVGGHLPDPATVTPGEYVTQSAHALLQDASLYQRKDGSSKPRVFIVGDSQALSLGYGLDRWTAENDRALVWNHGVEGCGVIGAGESRGSTDTAAERCRDAVAAWPAQLASFRPDVVIVLSSLTDIQPRRLNGASEASTIGDEGFDAFLASEYERAVDVLSSTGARVVWVEPPCTAIKETANQPNPYAAGDIAHLNEVVLPRVLRDRADTVTSFDLASVLCPKGEVLRSIDGVGELRPDGVHFSVAGALWFANTYGNQLLEAGGI